MTDQNQVDDLINMLDNLMSSGTGHVSITADELQNGIHVETVNSTACNAQKGACMQPTELDMDDD